MRKHSRSRSIRKQNFNQRPLPRKGDRGFSVLRRRSYNCNLGGKTPHSMLAGSNEASLASRTADRARLRSSSR